MRLAEVVDEPGTEPAPDVEHREPALEAQVALILCADALTEAWDDGVCIVNRFGPNEAREERQLARESFLGFELQRIVRRIRDVLALIDGAEIGESSKRLQITRTRREVLSRFGVQSRIEGPEATQVRPLAADIADLDHRAQSDIALEPGRPLLHVWRRGMRIETVVTLEPCRCRSREPVRDGQIGVRGIRFIDLVQLVVADQVVSFDGDFRAVVEPIAGAENGLVLRAEESGKSPGEAEAGSEVVGVRR